MIVVVDYGRGNLFSIGQALRHLNADYTISDRPEAVVGATKIIFPGVGAFGDAMAGLQARGLIEPLRAAVRAGTPLLGICVGCQLLLTKGEEFGVHPGLDLIPGTVSRLPEPRANDSDAVRIPNVGWRRLDGCSNNSIMAGLRPNDWMYFVHSYAAMVDNPAHVLATIRVNGRDVPAAVQSANVVGVQFHPEKSGPVGLKLLGRFLDEVIER